MFEIPCLATGYESQSQRAQLSKPYTLDTRARAWSFSSAVPEACLLNPVWDGLLFLLITIQQDFLNTRLCPKPWAENPLHIPSSRPRMKHMKDSGLSKVILVSFAGEQQDDGRQGRQGGPEAPEKAEQGHSGHRTRSPKTWRSLASVAESNLEDARSLRQSWYSSTFKRASVDPEAGYSRIREFGLLTTSFLFCGLAYQTRGHGRSGSSALRADAPASTSSTTALTFTCFCFTRLLKTCTPARYRTCLACTRQKARATGTSK